jgi:hypothetical protein
MSNKGKMCKDSIWSIKRHVWLFVPTSNQMEDVRMSLSLTQLLQAAILLALLLLGMIVTRPTPKLILDIILLTPLKVLEV